MKFLLCLPSREQQLYVNKHEVKYIVCWLCGPFCYFVYNSTLTANLFYNSKFENLFLEKALMRLVFLKNCLKENVTLNAIGCLTCGGQNRFLLLYGSVAWRLRNLNWQANLTGSQWLLSPWASAGGHGIVDRDWIVYILDWGHSR